MTSSHGVSTPREHLYLVEKKKEFHSLSNDHECCEDESHPAKYAQFALLSFLSHGGTPNHHYRIYGVLYNAHRRHIFCLPLSSLTGYLYLSVHMQYNFPSHCF